MHLSKTRIEEFQAIYQKEFGRKLEYDQAKSSADSLLKLISVIQNNTTYENEKNPWKKKNDTSKNLGQ